MLCVAALASAQYVTPDTGVTYTLQTLSTTEGSGVSATGENTFTLNADLTISANDKLQLTEGDLLEIADGVHVVIDGEAIFNPSATAYIRPATAEAQPAGFSIYGKATLANLDVKGGGFAYYGTEPFTADNCNFSQINSIRSAYGVIMLGGGKSSGNRISNCTFTDCAPGAINTPANMGVELTIENCVITNVSTDNQMRPFINITSCPDKDVVVKNNTVAGAKLEKPGGIGVSNMLNTAGDNRVYIIGNDVRDCSWGINLVGCMDVILKDNYVKDNCWDPSDDGGIAVTMYSIPDYPLKVYAERNTFEGNKWGPCSVYASLVNFGKTETDENGEANAGGNIFINNHFTNAEGRLITCDFCNNATTTAYVQNCVWNDATTAEDAAKYVGDTNFNSSYGPVVYAPIKEPSGVKQIAPDFSNTFNGEVEVFRMDGVLIFTGDASKIDQAGPGLYVVRQGKVSKRVLVK